MAHPARRYDYWLGGKDHFAADRESGDAIAEVFPSVRTAARQNRRFLGRAVRHLVAECGIRQILDIGTGLPSAENTHTVAQATASDSRIVYVDNDPLVMVHARALLTSTPEGRTDYVEADLRTPERILAAPELSATLDMLQPVALMLVAVVHFLSDQDDPYGVVARLLDSLAPGSYLVITHSTPEYWREDLRAKINAKQFGDFYPRERHDFARFLNGLDLLPPGIVPVARWRPDEEPPDDEDVCMYAAVGRKP